MKRSRRVHNPRYQELYSAPKNKKVVMIWMWEKNLSISVWVFSICDHRARIVTNLILGLSCRNGKSNTGITNVQAMSFISEYASGSGLCIVSLNAQRASLMQLQSLMIEMHKFVSIIDFIISICWLFYFNPSSSSLNCDWCNLDWNSIFDCINSICWFH